MKKTVTLKIKSVENLAGSVRAVMHPDVEVKSFFVDENGKKLTDKQAKKLQQKGNELTVKRVSSNSLWLEHPALRLQLTTDNPEIQEKLKEGKQVKITIEF